MPARFAPQTSPAHSGAWPSNDRADDLQRYKCRVCGVTFNALTGTPLARLRQREKWLLQA
jgi:transposase-like protein